MQILPCSLGQRGLCADQIPDHLPCRQIQRSFWSWSHGQRDRALWAKANSTRRRFLPRTNPRRLSKQKHRHRLFSCFKLPATPKAILTIQPAHSDRYALCGASPQSRAARHRISFTFSNARIGKQVCREIPAVDSPVCCTGGRSHYTMNQVLI